MSVIVPLVVPLIRTLTPIITSPALSFTTPEIARVVCEKEKRQ